MLCIVSIRTNIFTKLYGNPSMHKEVIAWNVTERQTDRQKCISIIPSHLTQTANFSLTLSFQENKIILAKAFPYFSFPLVYCLLQLMTNAYIFANKIDVVKGNITKLCSKLFCNNIFKLQQIGTLVLDHI